MATRVRVAAVLTCPECQQSFDEETKRARFLFCGHSLCSECINKLLRNNGGRVSCPTCHRINSQLWKKAADFPLNFIVERMLQEIQNAKNGTPDAYAQGEPRLNKGVCPSHKQLRLLFCDNHQEFICQDCTHEEHPSSTCHVVPIERALNDLATSEFDNVNLELRRVGSSANDIRDNIKHLIKYEVNIQNRLLNLAEQLKDVRQKKKEEEDAQITANFNQEKLKEILNIIREVRDFKDLEIVAQLMQNLHKETPASFSLEKQLLTADPNVENIMKSLDRLNVWLELNVGGRLLSGKVSKQDGRIHLHCLSATKLPQEALTVPYYLIRATSEDPVAFVDIKWTGKTSGRVYIRPFKDSLRGRQFLMLCSGELGVSYKASKFIDVWNRGGVGEYVRGGDYEFNDGTGGKGILEGVEKELIRYQKPNRKGLVIGHTWNNKIQCAQFGIRTQDWRGDDNTCFGEVIRGLPVLSDMIRQGLKGIQLDRARATPNKHNHLSCPNCTPAKCQYPQCKQFHRHNFDECIITDCGLVVNWDIVAKK